MSQMAVKESCLLSGYRIAKHSDIESLQSYVEPLFGTLKIRFLVSFDSKVSFCEARFALMTEAVLLICLPLWNFEKMKRY